METTLIPKCDGGLRIVGDSMYPLLKSGDIVFYKQVHDIMHSIIWGEMYLISFDIDGDEYVSVKYLQKSDIPDHIVLVSYNEHHKPMEIHINRIVFTTAFGQYAIDGYRVNALDYLLKPISYVDFLQAANKALQWFELVQKPEEIDSIFVKSDYKLVQVDLKKIMYIEGLKDYIKIYTEDASKPILSLMSMKAMEELLPSSRFIRVHRSFIVQKDKIRVIDRGRIVFDKTYIPISDSYKQVFQTFLDERS